MTRSRLLRWTVAPSIAIFSVAIAFADARADARSGDPSQKACLDAYENGQVERQAGHLLAARDRFRTCADAACPSVVRGDCSTWLAQADADVPTIAVAVRDATGQDVPGARVLLDGQPLTTTLDGRPAEVDPGEHTIRCELDGHAPVERAVVVESGEKGRTIAVTLDEPPPAPTAPVVATPPPDRTLSYALGGVGAAALVTFAYLGLSGRTDVSTMRETCAPHCAQDRVDSAHGKLVGADVSLVVGLASLGAATWFWLHPLGAKSHATGAIGVRPVAGGAVGQMGMSF